MDQLVSEWETFARRCLPAADVLDDHKLRDGAETVLRSIARDMRTAQSAQQSKEKAQGRSGAGAAAVTATARDHAAQRLRSGFTLEQLVSEYRALRASVTRAWSEAIDSADRELLHELVRFDEAMDQSLIEAISCFNEGVERARDIFVGILGHDLRDPLNAAISATELTGLLRDDPEKQRRANENASRSLQRMASMIDGLADFARTRLGGRLPISPSAGDMRQICEELLGELRLAHPGKSIGLECHGDLTGTWDTERMKQVVSNLASNAADYGSPTSPVTIVVNADSDHVELAVHNEGDPIPDEQQATIFDPLMRGALEAEEAGRSAESMGLGLYIVSQIAEAHGGTVKLHSNSSRGTTFTVRLPRHTVVE